MLKILSLLAAGFMASLSLTAYAANNVAGGGHMGGTSAQHMSSSGLGNTNGPNATDRDKGQDRAEDRRNAHATKHAKGEASQSKHKNSLVNDR